MHKIVADTLELVEAGEVKDAVRRGADYETVWDQNQAKLQKCDKATWKNLDEVSEAALSSVRYPAATPAEIQNDLTALIALLDNPNA